MGLKNRLVKWASITGVVALTAFLPTLSTVASATNSKDNSTHNQPSIPTIYHVYSGHSVIGTVSDPSVVTQEVSALTHQAETKNPGTKYVVKPSLTVIPERTFDPSYNNKGVTETLKDKLSVVPAAIGIYVNNKPIAYVNNKDDATQAVQDFEKQFLPNQTEKQLSMTKDSSTDSSLNLTSPDTTYKIQWMDDRPGDTNNDPQFLGIQFKQTIAYKSVPAESVQTLNPQDVVKLLTKGKLVNATYKVKAGDTLVSIAHQFGFKLSKLLQLNPALNSNSVLHIGDSVTVKKPKPLLDLQVVQNVKKNETITHTTEYKKSNNLYVGQKKVLQQGHDGQKHVVYKVTKDNGNVISKETLSETVTTDPQNEVVEVGTKVISSRGTGQFGWPTEGGVITSTFGMRWGAFHKGIDIAGVSNRSILAADNGVVESAGWDNGGYGNRVVINHNNGFKTTYNHMSKILVHAGQVVRKGQVVGIMGETGDATGVHLHFEVIRNGQIVNPSRYVHR